MERLTIPDVRVDEHTTRRSVIDVAAVREHAMEFYYRLKAYEDTEIEPEAVETVKLALAAKHMVDLETLNNTPISRLVELAEADKDGRVITLPCKVGDVLYAAETDPIIPLHVMAVAIYLEVEGEAYGDYERISNIGKTIFLTREEAEKALEGIKHAT